MDTAKLFVNGRTQALRLPKAYRFVKVRITNNEKEFIRIPSVEIGTRVKKG